MASFIDSLKLMGLTFSLGLRDFFFLYKGDQNFILTFFFL